MSDLGKECTPDYLISLGFWERLFIEKGSYKILGLDPEALNKELCQFYEARRKELKKRIEGKQERA